MGGPGLVHCHSSVIVSRQMNPTSGCPCPPATPKGVMTDRKARATGVGGEVLCYVA
jgi:hypothetical protein